MAVQIREQNKERRRAGINLLTAQWSDLVKTTQEHRPFAEMFLRGAKSFQSLDAADARNPEPKMYAAYGLDEISKEGGK